MPEGRMHRFLNFKSFADASIDLMRSMTILIGKNGSGKSNAIEGAELLAYIAHGTPLYEIGDVARVAGGFAVRGGLPGCGRNGRPTFTLEFLASVRTEGEVKQLRYSVTVRALPEPRIAAESLSLGGRVLFETVEGSAEVMSGIVRVRYDNFARGGNKPVVQLPADRSILSRYESLDPQSKKLANARVVVSWLREYLRASYVFDPQPRAMRGYERIGNSVLSRDGGNISAVLHRLSSGGEAERATLNRILTAIRQLPEEPFAEFAFVTTRLGDVIFGFKPRADVDSVTDARLLSDGTLRSLAVLTALETAADRSRIVVEEFDNGVHPSRVGVLSRAIWDCAKRKQLNVLCTTHNPATLDSLAAEQLRGVVLCYFDAASESSRLIELLQLPQVDVLLERGQLGDLVTARVLEQHLMPQFSEERKQKAREWLESLR